ncbi:MAG: pullulanase-type alpha-1,6-glucosidase [Gammaproteobacteria bacterium]|nr:MAG: pullulanase-type alpha-1,6-glucosidase [Gammaproteobacteria bacterium]
MNKVLQVFTLFLFGYATMTFATTDKPLMDSAAHWVEPGTILFIKQSNATRLAIQPNFVTSFKKLIPITENAKQTVQGFPHLNDFSAASINLPADAIKTLLKGELLLNQYDKQGALLASSSIQTAGIIDALYTAGAQDADEISDFGASVLADGVQFKVWSPTAKTVNVLLFDANKKPLTPAKLIMQEYGATGAWVARGGADLAFAYYQFEVTVYQPTTKKVETLVVSDPYSHSLSTDGFYSQVIDLNDAKTQPSNWRDQASPRVDAPVDNILYELHIRDFSASDTSIKNENVRGKYAAFLEKNSNGVKHLKELREAGLNVIHLMPTFDFATVNPDPEKTISLDDNLEKVCRLSPKNPACTKDINPKQSLRSLLESLNSRSGDAQAIIESLREQDNYNWGYDPFHYTVPQSSYAINPEGSARIIEFREMIAQLHNMGFKVIMDVVYNHTFAAGLNEKSVLDKIVPNYYHRLHPVTGAIEQSTCCNNTATEHVMMAKLMTDSLVVWARDYRINGFRFDLMGHQPKAVMLKARDAVRKIDPDTYFYGEGWNFGEVENNKRFVQSTQLELGGTGIGTYTDRLRDAVRGGSSMDSGKNLRINQGIGNGLFVVPNESQSADNNKAKYLNYIDQIQIGLAGNLAAFPLKNAVGKEVVGSGVDYNGSPAGYAKDPADTINYVSKHDNQTLWDNNQYRIAYSVSSADRVRMQALSLSYPLLAQGIPFLHMGCEFLRSKSFLRDSYDYGDWFNAVDFSKQSNNYDVGLPPAVKDKDNWPLIADVLKKSEGRDHTTPAQIALSNNLFLDFIKIRSSSPLFRLRTADDIIKRVSFPNSGEKHQPGLVVMKIDNTDVNNNLDPSTQQIIVVFNNGAVKQTFTYADAKQFRLHPVQAKGSDSLVKTSSANTKGFTVPAFTTAVFVR